MSKSVTIEDASGQLGALIHLAEQSEEVIILDRGQPKVSVCRPGPCYPQRPRLR